MTYEPENYWKDRVIEEANFTIQEDVLMSVLKNLDFQSVYEIGCGTGRIGMKLMKSLKVTEYEGLDINGERLSEFLHTVHQEMLFPQINLRENMYEREPVMAQSVDLVIAVEVLMHVRPEDIQDFINKMKNQTKKFIVSVDFDSYPKKPLAAHNFRHAYKKLYGPGVVKTPIGNSQSIFIWSK